MSSVTKFLSAFFNIFEGRERVSQHSRRKPKTSYDSPKSVRVDKYKRRKHNRW